MKRRTAVREFGKLFSQDNDGDLFALFKKHLEVGFATVLAQALICL